MALTDLIVTDPNICGGRPCIRGTRIMVKGIRDFLAAGYTHAEIIEEYPSLTPEQIDAAAKFRKRKL